MLCSDTQACHKAVQYCVHLIPVLTGNQLFFEIVGRTMLQACIQVIIYFFSNIYLFFLLYLFIHVLFTHLFLLVCLLAYWKGPDNPRQKRRLPEQLNYINQQNLLWYINSLRYLSWNTSSNSKHDPWGTFCKGLKLL